MPSTFAFSDVTTLIIGLVALFIGTRIRESIPAMRRIDMPNAVVGAMIVCALVLVSELWWNISVSFATDLRDLLLLVFFTTIGLSAKFKALRAGGRPLVIVCLTTILLLVIQNTIGVGVALAWGSHPIYGLLVGSLSFVGGTGTALAWAKEAEAMGLQHAQAVGVGAATLAVIAGALVAGPITGWIIRRHNLKAPDRPGSDVAFAPPAEELQLSEAPAKHADARESPAAGSIENIMSSILVIAISVYLGDQLNIWAKSAGILLPGFLSAMLAGIVMTNLADVFRFRLEFEPIQKGGEVALNLFLVLSLMGTKLAAIGAILTPLAINLALQILAIALVAYFILFRLLGRNYDAAVAVGGFLGFGISSMPVAMGTMDEVTRRYGPSPKAFLLITLAGSFFVDLANALVTKAFLLLPFIATTP